MSLTTELHDNLFIANYKILLYHLLQHNIIIVEVLHAWHRVFRSSTTSTCSACQQ